MTAPIWLIAEREIRTYVATASFWAALAIGPLAAGAMLIHGGGHQAIAVSVQSQDKELARSASAAVQEAADLEGRRLAIGGHGERLVLTPRGAGRLSATFGAQFPLSNVGRALVERTLERDAARHTTNAMPLVVHDDSVAPRGPGVAAISRFALVCILWLTLTGSLGMLLQAVVRERANRALEGLLAAARPWDIVIGKLSGVGAVSLIVLAAWLASAACLSALMPSGGVAAIILAKLAAPATLLRAALIYLLAYAFYGSITIALGAMARDVAAAQNLSRPMFVVLVIAFFVAMASASSQAAAWLVYVPAFSPFLMLLSAPELIPTLTQLVLLAILLACSIAAASFAAGRLSIQRSSIRDTYACFAGAAIAWVSSFGGK